jgi:hypothetical protein
MLGEYQKIIDAIYNNELDMLKTLLKDDDIKNASEKLDAISIAKIISSAIGAENQDMLKAVLEYDGINKASEKLDATGVADIIIYAA